MNQTRRSDSRLTAVFAASLVGLVGTAVPGLAADDGGTSATVILSATGSLSIVAPDDSGGAINLVTADYDTGDSGAATWPGVQVDIASVVSALDLVDDVKGQLGDVTVTDARLGLLQSWDASVTWTDFEQSGAGGDATKIIELENVRYSAGASSTVSVGAFTPSVTPVESGDDLGSYLGVAPLLSGQSTVTWDPTLYFDLQGEIAGTYTGTITHSVS